MVLWTLCPALLLCVMHAARHKQLSGKLQGSLTSGAHHIARSHLAKHMLLCWKSTVTRALLIKLLPRNLQLSAVTLDYLPTIRSLQTRMGIVIC